MGRIGGRQAAIGAFVVAAAAAAGGCFKTDLVAKAFNGGALDSPAGDPRHTPRAVTVETAVRAAREELDDGYFQQGGAATRNVSRWMRLAASDDRLFDAIVAIARDGDVKRDALLALADGWSSSIEGAPAPALCPRGTLDEGVAGALLDRARFRASIDRAGAAIAGLLRLRVHDSTALRDGLHVALAQTAMYLERRTWHRSMARPVVGVVAKGGAVSGLYAAGVVWVALRIIEECKKDTDCGRDLTPQLVSGTSTGALIATAVDYFGTDAAALRADADAYDRVYAPLHDGGAPPGWTDAGAPQQSPACTFTTGRTDLLQGSKRFAAWFTCNALQDLMCVRSAPIFKLAEEQRGALEFLGIQAQMRHQLRGCATLRNSTELVLSTVDFRTGRLFALSDTDPWGMQRVADLVQGATASAVLPIIAKPVDHLPVDYYLDAGVPPPRFTYLDGGIRSELPVLPLARRGAERVLVVSSSGPLTGETNDLRTALSIGPRYIEIETGASAEVEVQRAQEAMERVRGAEIDGCVGWAPAAHADKADDVALCEGRYREVCGARQPRIRTTRSGPERVGTLWRMTNVYRDEVRVPGSPGYRFDPTDQRALFLGGAEAARARCLEIAETLGIDNLLDPKAEALRKRVVGWCAGPMPGVDELCGQDAGRDPQVRDCPSAAEEVTCEPLLEPQLRLCSGWSAP